MVKKRVLLWDWTNSNGPGNAGVPWMMDKVNFKNISSVSNWNTWVPPELKGRVPFRPMVRTLAELGGQDWQTLLTTHEKIIHFFNEPERGGISPEQAASLWKQQMVPLRRDKQKKLVSPSCANDQAGQNWINKWLSLVEDSPPDYLGLHYYGPDAGPMKDFLKHMHGLHPKLPVIVSEWACISRDHNAVIKMTLDLLSWMDGQDWIFEHALFACQRKVDPFVGPAAILMNADGSFTDLFLKYESGGEGKPQNPPNSHVWIVKAGDTFWSISKALGTTVEAMKAANPGVVPEKLVVGQRLNVPKNIAHPVTFVKAANTWFPIHEDIEPIKEADAGVYPKALNTRQRISLSHDVEPPKLRAATRAGNWTIEHGDATWSISQANGISLGGSEPIHPSAANAQPETAHSPVAAVFQIAAAAASSSYTIMAGDTFWSIAQAHGTTVAALQAANPGVNPSALKVGQVIKLPGGSSGGSTGNPTQNYTIKAGDTFWSIAQAHGISVGDLQAANPGVKPESLRVGQVIKIPSGGSPGGGSPGGGNGKVNYSGPASNFPSIKSWAAWDKLWTHNSQLMKYHDSDTIIGYIKKSILDIAKESGVDARAILCIIIQESGGDPTVVATNNGVRNPGLMQSHNGVEFNPKDPAGSIRQMIKDGTEGTRDGPGLKQLLAQYGNYYKAFRAYNSGSVDESNLSNGITATPSYVSDVANRLLGHVWPGM